jgi:hypothetical protein
MALPDLVVRACRVRRRQVVHQPVDGADRATDEAEEPVALLVIEIAALMSVEDVVPGLVQGRSGK